MIKVNDHNMQIISHLPTITDELSEENTHLFKSATVLSTAIGTPLKISKKSLKNPPFAEAASSLKIEKNRYINKFQ